MINMKRILFVLGLVCCMAGSINAQRSETYESWDNSLMRGEELSREGYYAISCKYLEEFVAKAEERVQAEVRVNGGVTAGMDPAERARVERAEYLICYNHFMMKELDLQERADAHLAKYPESAYRSHLYFMKGRTYYEKKNWQKVIDCYAKANADDLKYEDSELMTFTEGYANMKMGKYDKAAKKFKESMMTSKSFYDEAGYYYGYSEFCQKNYNEAIEAFHEVSDKSKYKEAAEFHILQIYDMKGQRTAAVEKGKELLKNYPKSEYKDEAYRIIGENAYRSQKFDDAASALTNYANTCANPKREDLYMLGLANYQTQKYSQAISALGKLTSEQDSMARNAYMFMGYSYLQLNQPQNARVAFQRAALMEGDAKAQEEAAYNYALATYESHAPFGETVKSFENFVEKYPNSKYKMPILELTAEAYMNEPNYQAAIEAIDKMDVKNDKLKQVKETALFKLGVGEMENKNYAKAKEYFSKSIEMNNSKSPSSQAYLWRAECSYKTGKLTEAQTDIKKYLATPQKKSTDCLLKAYYTLGYTYWEQKNYAMARPYFSKFQEVKGSEKSDLASDVICRIGDCYYNNRDFDNALNTYWSVPVKDKYADYSLYQIGQIYGLQHKYADKIDVLQKLCTRHPQSDYHDEAMYEIGRTYVLQDKDNDAIAAYMALQTKHPMSKWTRKATLEIAMLNANMGKTEEAINAYKFVVDKYPSSEEARVALEGMQGLYVEENKVDEYLAYRQSVSGIIVETVNRTEEDSLQFLAAERVYMKGDWNTAIGTLNNYIVKYCNEVTVNCISAQYYLAESYYNIGNKQQALLRYHKLTTMDGNTYMEPSLIRAAEIAYDREEYGAANTYFSKLLLVATTGENRAAARLGVLRCSYYTNLYEQTISAANEIMGIANTSDELKREARYNRAKSYLALHKADSAAADLKALATESASYAVGAEATYLYAQYLYDKGKYKLSEEVIMQFIEAGTQYPYWMARSFVLLSDIYKAQGNDVMARMHLESLRENYTEQDDIQDMITERMKNL